MNDCLENMTGTVSIHEFDKMFNEHQKLGHQIDKLATFIMEEIEGEPMQSQGAIDTAIRLLGKQSHVPERNEILDSGERREFETGAVRDVSNNSGRCDLLPLIVVGELMQNIPLTFIGKYVECGGVQRLYDAIKGIVDGLPDAMLQLAVHFEKGANKYNDRNWEKGIPLHCYIDSAVRHYLKYLRGDKDEKHQTAAIWNLMCAIWTHENRPSMIDLPFANLGDKAGMTGKDLFGDLWPEEKDEEDDDE